MSEQPERSRRQAGGELVIPAMAVVFTVYYLSTIINSPWTAQVSAFLIGGVLLTLCAILFVKTALAVARRRATLGLNGLIGRDDLRTGRAGLALATLGYVLLIDWGGFTLTTFLFLAVSMMILSNGKRPGLIVLLSAAMALGGWALFIWAFDTRFPRGWFEEVMKAAVTHG